MNADLSSLFEARINDFRSIANNSDSYPSLKLEALAKRILDVFASGGRIAFIGNGGSAAEATHIAAEFTGRCVIDHIPLPVLCFNESLSSITAIANDYGFDKIFSRQVAAHLRPGDLLIALSTSGTSKNILAAFEEAKQNEIHSILWMGDFDSTVEGTEIWKVPSQITPRIQEIHLLWGHMLAEIIETCL